MTTDRYKNFRPTRPSLLDTTQRVVEQTDYADGVSDVCWDAWGARMAPGEYDDADEIMMGED